MFCAGRRAGGLVVVLSWLALIGAGCGGPHLFSPSQEVQIGRRAGDQFEAKYGLDQDLATVARVANIAARVTPAAEPPNYPYDVRVLDSLDVFAVAFPGGRVYLSRGLIEALSRDPDQLAWVLGHEVTLVARRYATQRVEQKLGYEAVLSSLLQPADNDQLSADIVGLVQQSYSRPEETEADRGGMTLAHAAGYDPTAALGVLKRFQQLQGNTPSDAEIMFGTEPGDAQRVQSVKEYLQSQGWQGRYYQY